MVNGAVADTTGPVYATRLLQDGDMVSCTMTGGLACSPPVTAPEVIEMTVYPLPTILLTQDTIIGGGMSIRLAPVLSGDITQYQWSPVVGLDDPTIAGSVGGTGLDDDISTGGGDGGRLPGDGFRKGTSLL